MGNLVLRRCSWLMDLTDGRFPDHGQSCLKKMQLADGSYRWKIPRPWPMGNNKISVKLPAGLRCSQCVIQWKWHCGNNWGCDKSGCGMGHGPQEEFYGCADVKIV